MRIRRTIAGAAVAVFLMAGLAPQVYPAPIESLPRPLEAPKPKTPYEKGIAALRAGDLATAQAELERAASENPNAAEPHLGLAEVYHRQNDLPRVETELKAAIAADPKSANAQTAWGLFLLGQKRDTDAAQTFEAAIKLAPTAIPPRMSLAELQLSRLNKADQAADLYRSVIALQPRMASAHAGLAVALVRLNRTDEAIPELLEAQKDAPSDPQPSFLLGEIQAGRGNNEQAITEFNRAIRVQPNFIPAHAGKGDILLAKGDYSGAITAYRAALTIDPKLPTVLVNLGVAQQRNKQVDDAVASFQRALELDPKQPIALNNLAWITVQRGDHPDKALVWAKEAVALVPDNASFLDTLGWVYRANGNLPDAKVQLTHALSLKPEAETAYHLGVVDEELDDRVGAEAAFKQALEIDPNYAPASAALEKLSQTQ